jgi:hypothetical protein
MIYLLPNIEYLVASSTYAGGGGVAVKLLFNKSPNRHEGTHRQSIAYVFPEFHTLFTEGPGRWVFSEVRDIRDPAKPRSYRARNAR